MTPCPKCGYPCTDEDKCDCTECVECGRLVQGEEDMCFECRYEGVEE